MTPSLLEAAKAVTHDWDSDEVCSMSPSIERLRAAIEEEERKPKVERVEIWPEDHHALIYNGKEYRHQDGWTWYAERPLPVKSNRASPTVSDEAVEEFIKELAEMNPKVGLNPEYWIRRAAELRRKG